MRIESTSGTPIQIASIVRLVPGGFGAVWPSTLRR